MSTPLFSNIPHRDEEVVKSAKFTRVACPVMCVLMVLLCATLLYEERYDIETAILLLIMPIFFVCFFNTCRIFKQPNIRKIRLFGVLFIRRGCVDYKLWYRFFH